MADIRAELQQRPMNGFQIFVIAVMVFLNGLDGFDVLAMSFANNFLREEWGITQTTAGWLISAGLIGMMTGSLAIAPLADKYGRRALTLVALVLVTVGMFASAFTHITTGFFDAIGVDAVVNAVDFDLPLPFGVWSVHPEFGDATSLFFWRIITGLGIGTMLASIASFTAEYSNAKNRSLCISIMAIGYPAGAVLGGLAVTQLLGATGGDWRVIFIFGGVCSLLVLPLVWLFIPDSPDFLITQRPKGALAKLNKVLAKLGVAPVTDLPEAGTHERDVKIYPVLFRNHFWSTLKITVTYFLFAWALYFALGWLPGILGEAGFTPVQGISGAVIMNSGGVLGGILFGIVAGRFGGLRNTVGVAMVLCYAFFVVFGLAPADLTLLLALGFVVGFFLIATVSGLYATYPVIFPATVRTTGTGIVIGVGRIGGILSPIVAGIMIDGGASRALLCIVLAAPLILTAILLRTIPELNSAAARGKLQAASAH